MEIDFETRLFCSINEDKCFHYLTVKSIYFHFTLLKQETEKFKLSLVDSKTQKLSIHYLNVIINLLDMANIAYFFILQIFIAAFVKLLHLNNS